MKRRLIPFRPVSLLFLFTLIVLFSTSLFAGEQDPVESLYDSAQEALAQEEYRQAAAEFHRIYEEYSASAFAGDALYWEAFAWYRLGGISNLRTAGEVLALQNRQYAEAATSGDAAELAARIRGELARRGDVEAAELVARQAAELAVNHAEIVREAERISEEFEVQQEIMERLPLPAMVPEPPAQPSLDEEEDTRLVALNALISIDPDRAFPIVRKILSRRTEDTARLREQAIFLIGQEYTKESEDLLLDVIENDPAIEVREVAVFWLSNMKSESTLLALADIAKNSSDVRLRLKAVEALAHNPDTRSLSLLEELAADENAPRDFRQIAIMGIADKNVPESFSFLDEMYDNLTDSGLKEGIIFAIANLSEDRTGKWLRSVFLDDSEDESNRTTALHLAGEGGYIKTDELVELYDRFELTETREQVIYMLGHSKDPVAVDKLITIAGSETDSGLQRTAIFWLGNTGDTRALDFLEELINR